MWIKITDEYLKTIKPFAKRKIRIPKVKLENQWAFWDVYEKCFFWNSGDEAVYMTDADMRPAYRWVGEKKKNPNV